MSDGNTGCSVKVSKLIDLMALRDRLSDSRLQWRMKHQVTVNNNMAREAVVTVTYCP